MHTSLYRLPLGKAFEYHEDHKLDKSQILRFATGQYIDEGHHIILKGASGNGKTYTLPALLAIQPAAVSKKYNTSVCRNCWTN